MSLVKTVLSPTGEDNGTDKEKPTTDTETADEKTSVHSKRESDSSDVQ
jgi:hypothetical protein